MEHDSVQDLVDSVQREMTKLLNELSTLITLGNNSGDEGETRWRESQWNDVNDYSMQLATLNDPDRY